MFSSGNSTAIALCPRTAIGTLRTSQARNGSVNTSGNPSSGLAALSQQLQQAVHTHQRRLQASSAQLVRRVTEAQEQLRARQMELHQQAAELAGRGCDAAAHPTDAPGVAQHIEELLARLEQQLAGLDGAGDHSRTEVAALREHNEELVAEVEALRARLDAAEGAGPGGGAWADDSDRIATLETALDKAEGELEELRLQNEELAGRVASSRMKPADSDEPTGPLSWEQQKQRLLKQLENEDTSGSAKTTSTGETVEDFVRRTQKLLADRDAELAELRQLLTEQAAASSGMAVGAAAIADMLDQDQLIREEREKLQEMQKQWQEKLRAAEIELSLERAQLSRQRLEMEERMAKLAEDEERLRSACQETERAEGAGSRRWLARLGLNSDASDGDD